MEKNQITIAEARIKEDVYKKIFKRVKEERRKLVSTYDLKWVQE